MNMVLYNCYCCNYASNIKCNWGRHLKSNKHLTKTSKIDENMVMSTNEHKMSTNEHKMSTNEHKCNFCSETFTTKPNKRRHEIYRCKHNTSLINKDSIEKDKKIKKLEKRVEKLTDRIGNTTTNIQTNNNIKINSYGKEDLNHITNAFKTSLLSGPYGAIPKMIEAIHFNDSVPENKNILLPNINKNILKIKKDEEWIHKNKELIILDMIDSKYLMLDDHFNLIVNGETLNKFTKDIFNKFRSKYEDGNIELISDIKGDCNLMFMNNRHK